MLERIRSLLGGKTSAAPAHFMSEVEQILRGLPNVAEVRRVDGGLALNVYCKSGTEHRLNLDNAFAETRELSPADRRARLIEMFGAAVSGEAPLESWAEVRDQLVPVLRASIFGIEIWSQAPEARFVRRPFLPYLNVIVAIDRPSSMSYVTRASLRRWNVGENDVLAASEERLKRFRDSAIELYDKTHGPLWIVNSKDSYEASRLLVPGWLASFRGRVEGEPVAIVPAASMVLVGGDGRKEMLGRLVDIADRECAASTRGVSPAIYGVDSAGKVVPYLLGAGPMAKRCEISHAKLALSQYDGQKRVLDRLHGDAGLDVFTASYKVFESAGALRSASIWTKGITTYLPHSDVIVLQELNEDPGEKPKASVELPFETVRPYLAPAPELDPARWKAESFPDHLLHPQNET